MKGKNQFQLPLFKERISEKYPSKMMLKRYDPQPDGDLAIKNNIS